MSDRLEDDPIMRRISLEAISQELVAIQGELKRREEERASPSARAWDLIAKVSQVALLAIASWVWTLGDRVTETEAKLREIASTRFTAQDGLALEARAIARENPQVALLVQEMRALTVTVSERLARLETQVQALQQTPR